MVLGCLTSQVEVLGSIPFTVRYNGFGASSPYSDHARTSRSHARSDSKPDGEECNRVQKWMHGHLESDFLTQKLMVGHLESDFLAQNLTVLGCLTSQVEVLGSIPSMVRYKMRLPNDCIEPFFKQCQHCKAEACQIRFARAVS